jgi:hypothetical protein
MLNFIYKNMQSIIVVNVVVANISITSPSSLQYRGNVGCFGWSRHNFLSSEYLLLEKKKKVNFYLALCCSQMMSEGSVADPGCFIPDPDP